MQKQKKSISALGWVLRALAGVIAFLVLAVGGFIAWFTFAVYPQLRVEGARTAAMAEAFAKLTGSARRLAIYDAFCDQIEAHYYDKTFIGTTWKAMRRDWRVKAAGVSDDTHLYTEVLIPATQSFPTSHVGVQLPPRSEPTQVETKTKPVAVTESNIDMDQSMGFQMVQFRRGTTTGGTVGDVYPGSAAASAGIEPGWILGSVSVSVMPTAASSKGHVTGSFITPDTDAQRSEYDRTVRFTVENAPLSQEPLHVPKADVAFDFTLDKPEIAFETRRLAGGARYVRFNEFNATQMDKVLAAIDLADEHGLILDLRRNHGGDFRERVRLLSRLLPPHTVFERDVEAGRSYAERTDFFSRRYHGPVVVLIGPASASSAETIPAALRDYHRAVLIGRTTNGSVLGSEKFLLPDRGWVQIPVNDVVTVKGEHLEAKGVVPDIVIMPSLSAIRAGRDPALERAQIALSQRLKT